MISWAKLKPSSFNQIPNVLSLSRIFFGLAMPVLLVQSNPRLHIAAFAIFIIGALTDYFDGIIARRYAFQSSFGKFIDPLTDKVLILAPLCAFSYLGVYSPWWIVPIALREIVVTFCRLGWLLEGKVLGAEKLGKYKLGSQVAVITSSFLFFISWEYQLYDWLVDFFRWSTFFLMCVTVILTLVSGFTFLYANRKHFDSVFFAKYTAALGVGFLPAAPGLWGSLLGLGIALLVQWNLLLYLFLFLGFLVIGYWAVNRMGSESGKDPQFVVIDETCGMMLSLIAIPFSWKSVLFGLIFFRIFDILKPFPLRRLEKIPGYWGILFDDLGAGIYTWFVLQVMLSVWS